MNLEQALSLPLGRSVALSDAAVGQLLSRDGTLMQQSARLHQQVLHEASLLLQEPLSLRRQVTAPLLRLTEHEHPGWLLLALGSPPIYSAQQTRDDLGRALGLRARLTPTGDLWADWLVGSLMASIQPLLLGCWGILLPWVCLCQQERVRPEVSALAQQLRCHPELLEPRTLAQRLVWAALTLLHGGLPLPQDAAITQLARSLLSLRERTQVGLLPTAEAIRALLGEWLPALDDAQAAALIRQFEGQHLSDDPAYLTGIDIIHQPGQVALWRRSRAQVQLIVTSSPRSPLPVAWEWQL